MAEGLAPHRELLALAWIADNQRSTARSIATMLVDLGRVPLDDGTGDGPCRSCPCNSLVHVAAVQGLVAVALVGEQALACISDSIGTA